MIMALMAYWVHEQAERLYASLTLVITYSDLVPVHYPTCTCNLFGCSIPSLLTKPYMWPGVLVFTLYMYMYGYESGVQFLCCI